MWVRRAFPSPRSTGLGCPMEKSRLPPLYDTTSSPRLFVNPPTGASSHPQAGASGVEPCGPDLGHHGSAAIVLLSDGENTGEPDPIELADLASGAGVRIFRSGSAGREARCWRSTASRSRPPRTRGRRRPSTSS